MAWAIAAIVLAGCAGGGKGVPGVPGPTPTPAATPTPNVHVLVVANSAISDSMQLAQSYMSGRHIPAANLVPLPLNSDPTVFAISQPSLQSTVYAPVASAIQTLHGAGSRIDFVVMMYGMPYLVNSGTFSGYSVDGIMSQATGAFPAAGSLFNPYYGSTSAFSSDTYHMVLVTRLDGRSVADVNGLITNGLKCDGTKPNGEFFFDVDPTKGDGYTVFNTAMQTAQSQLAAKGFDAEIDNTIAFVAPAKPLIGYVSWGSNDAHYSAAAYHALTFVPGGIAETAVSTSASNIRTPGGGQSQIADLIHQGVTGVHGDVTEPYLNAIPDPPSVFAAYTDGRTLGESFWAGLSEIVWKEIVIGDPLCTPY
ncbi:MAG: TIGR03790 family protein [Candidatus Eremiobacteraeota bacterium]|nr:TIGR03790 family protein [Candidatus Eremiobacteraeota bacterium]